MKQGVGDGVWEMHRGVEFAWEGEVTISKLFPQGPGGKEWVWGRGKGGDPFSAS